MEQGMGVTLTIECTVCKTQHEIPLIAEVNKTRVSHFETPGCKMEFLVISIPKSQQ